MLDDLRFRLRSLFRARAVESEMEAELRFHSEHQLEKYLESGLSREEALRRVRLNFGGIDQVKEECRDARGLSLVEAFLQDARYGWRVLRKSPGFTAVALFTLALGIGANTAIFSVVYAVLLRPLPFRDPATLVVLNETTPKVGNVSVSFPNFVDWRAQSRTFSEMAAFHGVQFNLAGISRPENINGLAVTPNFLPMMGIRPLLGRGFTAAEEKPGSAPVLLVGYSLWQSHFGGDRDVVGRSITLDSRRYTIVGVMPREFRWTERIDIVEPTGAWAEDGSYINAREERGNMLVAGRLAPGKTIQQARAEMEGIAARLARAYPEANDQFGVSLQPLRELFSGNVRPAILVLLGAAVFVLLVACANVANLFLMRGAVRAREIALRIAIGASRGRIVLQMLTEGFLVAILGGLVGVGLAVAGIPAISQLVPAGTLGENGVSLNGPVLLFSAGLVIVSMFIFALAPALSATHGEVQGELKEAGKATGGAAGNRWRGVLAAAEIAFALILLVGAGLMMKSLYRLVSVDSGIRPERVVKLVLSLRTVQYDKDPAILAFWQQLLDGVRAIPGVEDAGLGTAIPLTDNHWRSDITIEGAPLPAPGSFPHPDMHVVSPGYVSTLGIRVLRGRGFVDTDREGAPPVAMINATLARRLFPNQDAVGKRFLRGRPRTDRQPQWITIVGVVADTKLYGLANPARMEAYFPFRQLAMSDMTLVVKTGYDASALTSAIRAVVTSIDKDQPLFDVATMQKVMENSIFTQRVTLILLGLFSVLALVLAAIGIYGVISYSVAQRAREIGIRMALGAQRGDVLRLILRQGCGIAAAGIVAGSVASAGLTRLMTKLLYSVSAVDPATFGAVAAGLGVVALLACYIPARRTLRNDPLGALRHE